jgi:hypothetical protein
MDKLLNVLSTAFSTLGTTGRVVIGLFLCVTLYLLPAGVAMLRGRKNTTSIFVLNFFLGWTLLGWVVSLVWALKAED